MWKHLKWNTKPVKTRLSVGFFMLAFICCMYSANAQQEALFTQYMFNPYVINPAIAGTYNYYQIRNNSRFQWAGLKGAPVINTLSMYGPFENNPMGVGGFINYFSAGAASMLSLNGSYAYNYAITDEVKISLGLTLGVIQYKTDFSRLDLSADINDPLNTGTVETAYAPNGQAGLYVFSTLYHFGFAAHQLLPSKLNLGEEPTGLSKLYTHYYITGAYKWFINRDYAIEPTVLVKTVKAASPQLDVNVQGYYKGMVKAGLGVRTSDAISIMIGYIHDRKIEIGYSYDIGISAIRPYHSGSHELYIGYKFNSIKD